MAEAKAEPSGRQFPIKWNRQTALDVLFVLVLPVTGLVLDPGFLAGGLFGPGMLSFFQLPAYFLIALLTVAFWVSYLPIRQPFLAEFIGGGLILGIMLSVPVFLYLVPQTLIVIYSSLKYGNLTYITLAIFVFALPITAYRCFCRQENLREQPGMKKTAAGFPVVAGFLAPAALAVLLHTGTKEMLDDSFQELRSGDPVVVRAAAERLVSHPFCLSSCRQRIVLISTCETEVVLPHPVLSPHIKDDEITEFSKGCIYF